MKVRKYVNWNTLKGDSWIGYRFQLLPAIQIHYDKNGIMGEEYSKELWLSFDFLMFSSSLIISWKQHKELI